MTHNRMTLSCMTNCLITLNQTTISRIINFRTIQFIMTLSKMIECNAIHSRMIQIIMTPATGDTYPS
jgi:hypothetical protein